MATFKSHLSDLYQPHRISVSSPPDSGQNSLLVSSPPLHGTSCDVSTAEPFPLHSTFHHSPSRKIFPCFSPCFSTDLPVSVKMRVGWALKPPHYCFKSLGCRCAMVSLVSETGMPKHFVICSIPRSGVLVRQTLLSKGREPPWLWWPVILACERPRQENYWESEACLLTV